MSEKKPRSPAADIGKQQVAAVYAKGLLGASEKAGVTESVLEEFDSLVDDVFEQLPQLEATLSSQRLSVAEKLGVLDRAFGGRMSDNLLTFLKVVAQHGRLDCLRQIRRAARTQLNELRHRVEVYVTTAEPINDDLRSRIADALRNYLGREIDLIADVSPELIGGMVVRVGDTVYDSSVLNKLGQMRSQAIQRAVREMREHADRFSQATVS